MIFQNDPHWTPEQRLIAAILIAAYRDMLTDTKARSERWSDAALVQQIDVDRAMRFLTDRWGPNAKLRNHYASLLGIDGDLLAVRLTRMLDGDLPMPHFSFDGAFNRDARKRSLARHAQCVAAARARWLHLKYPAATSRPRSVRTPEPVTL